MRLALWTNADRSGERSASVEVSDAVSTMRRLNAA